MNTNTETHADTHAHTNEHVTNSKISNYSMNEPIAPLVVGPGLRRSGWLPPLHVFAYAWHSLLLSLFCRSLSPVGKYPLSCARYVHAYVCVCVCVWMNAARECSVKKLKALAAAALLLRCYCCCCCCCCESNEWNLAGILNDIFKCFSALPAPVCLCGCVCEFELVECKWVNNYCRQVSTRYKSHCRCADFDKASQEREGERAHTHTHTRKYLFI